MKILVLSLMLVMSSTAFADISVECKKSNGSKGVELSLADGWTLYDFSEPSLKKGMSVEPLEETKTEITFLYDYGSDYTKAQYQFEGMDDCGIYESGAKVVTLTKSYKTFQGKIRNQEVQKCTCDED